MQLTITPTPDFVFVDHSVCRRWVGHTDGGVPCDVFVKLIRVGINEDQSKFRNDLATVPESHISPVESPGTETTPYQATGLM